MDLVSFLTAGLIVRGWAQVLLSHWEQKPRGTIISYGLTMESLKDRMWTILAAPYSQRAVSLEAAEGTEIPDLCPCVCLPTVERIPVCC